MSELATRAEELESTGEAPLGARQSGRVGVGAEIEGWLAVAAKSWPQLSQMVNPRLTFSPQTGQVRPFGRVMNQIKERTMKPKNQMNQSATTAIPVPASLAEVHVDWLM